jgi:hypothetical protein
MRHTERRTLCNCFSKGDLTFEIDGKQETGLGMVEFVVRQQVIESRTKEGAVATPGHHRIEGVFFPKDAKTSAKLVQLLDNVEIRTISGMFEDRNTGREGEVRLEGVLFPSILIGWSSWTFTANSGRCPGE